MCMDIPLNAGEGNGSVQRSDSSAGTSGLRSIDVRGRVVWLDTSGLGVRGRDAGARSNASGLGVGGMARDERSNASGLGIGDMAALSNAPGRGVSERRTSFGGRTRGVEGEFMPRLF